MRIRVLSLLTILFTTFSGLSAQAQALLPYYGSDFYTGYDSGKLRDQELLNALQKILAGGHIKNDQAPDTIVSSCQGMGQAPQNKCIQHSALGYDGARKQMFGKLFLEQIGGAYAVEDVYCQHAFTDQDFGGKPNIGPGLIPKDGAVLNTEHTWPQSRFTNRFPKETQKSDLHHLFPTDSKMNSVRGSLHFGQVVEEVEQLKCPKARLGHQSNREIVFEAPTQHRGNVARAIFYFATRYQMKISPPEETELRQWNSQDPVDEAEFNRNNEVEKLQGNRNPFVDFPTLVDHIQHF